MVVSESSSNIKSVKYNNIVLGNKVILRKRSGISKDIHHQWKTAIMGNITDSVLAIASCKKEILKSNPILIITDGSRLIRQQVKYKKTLYGGYTTSVMYIIYVPSRLHHVSLTNLINILLYRQRYVTIKLSISHREDT